MDKFIMIDKITVILKYMSLEKTLKIDDKIYKLNPDFTMVYREVGSDEFVNVPDYISRIIVPYAQNIDHKEFNKISDLVDCTSIVGMVY